MSTPTASVLIQSLIRRAGGSKIPLYGKTYHFAPENAADPESIHTCALPFDDAAAIHRFLAIKEGFQLVDPHVELPAKPKAEVTQTMAADRAAAPVDKAPTEPVIITNDAGEKIDLTAMDRESLVAFAKDNFDIKAHHKWSDATLIGKIVEATRAAD